MWRSHAHSMSYMYGSVRIRLKANRPAVYRVLWQKLITKQKVVLCFRHKIDERRQNDDDDAIVKYAKRRESKTHAVYTLHTATHITPAPVVLYLQLGYA